jgi:anti-sigma factor RsiW
MPQLSRYIDGELDGHHLAELEAHLGACGFCRGARTDMVEANRSYRAIIPPVIAVPGLLDRIADATAASVPAHAASAGTWIKRIGGRKAAAGVGGVATIVVVGLLLWPSSWKPIVTDFTRSSAGWTISGDAGGLQRTATFVATGGQPGGHVTATDDVTGVTWFWRAPAAYHGDLSAAYGRTLTFNIKQSSVENPFDDADVVMRSDGRTVYFDLAVDPGAEWSSYRIGLRASAGWRDAATGAIATERELREVLANVTDLLIRGEYSRGADVGDLDNVEFGAR